jgi:hypothetical protein
MRAPALPADLRIQQLLADRATEGLSARDADALDAYADRHPQYDYRALDLAAAALDLGFSQGRAEAMPPPLRARLVAEAHALARGRAEEMGRSG